MYILQNLQGTRPGLPSVRWRFVHKSRWVLPCVWQLWVCGQDIPLFGSIVWLHCFLKWGYLRGQWTRLCGQKLSSWFTRKRKMLSTVSSKACFPLKSSIFYVDPMNKLAYSGAVHYPDLLIYILKHHHEHFRKKLNKSPLIRYRSWFMIHSISLHSNLEFS